jgi:cytochrome oxidase assembly protein ShyY1
VTTGRVNDVIEPKTAKSGTDPVFWVSAKTGSVPVFWAGAAVAPVGGLTVISFHNNHLVYALTGFAMGLMAADASFAIGRGKI